MQNWTNKTTTGNTNSFLEKNSLAPEAVRNIIMQLHRGVEVPHPLPGETEFFKLVLLKKTFDQGGLIKSEFVSSDQEELLQLAERVEQGDTSFATWFRKKILVNGEIENYEGVMEERYMASDEYKVEQARYKVEQARASELAKTYVPAIVKASEAGNHEEALSLLSELAKTSQEAVVIAHSNKAFVKAIIFAAVERAAVDAAERLKSLRENNRKAWEN